MSERKRRTEENIEDVQRISDIVNRKAKKGKKKNPYLNPGGGFNLDEKSVGIDYMPYEPEKIRTK